MSSSPAFAKHPQHQIIITQHVGPVRICFNGGEVAKSVRALKMAEGNYPPVYYLPLADCKIEKFSKTNHATFCPFKGTASYWTLIDGSNQCQNAVWAYEDPFDEVASIGAHVAFYTDREKIEIFS